MTCLSSLGKQDFSIKKYYLSRAKKIYLPLAIVATVTVIIIKLVGINWLNLKAETLSVLLGYNNFWQLGASLDYFARHINSPFMHLWYIAILLQFELVFPIVFALFKKIDRTINDNISTIIVFLLTCVSCVLFIVMSQTHGKMEVYYNTCSRVFSILIGVFLAIVDYKYCFDFFSFFKEHHNITFFIYLAVLVGLCIFVPDDSAYYAIYMLVASIISMRLIKYATVEWSFPKRSYDYLTFLSKGTYEVYLVQYPIIFLFSKVAMDMLTKTTLVLVLSIVIGYLINLLVNIKIKNKIFKVIRIISFTIIIIIGILFVLLEKDNTAEMQELEERLKENQQLIEEKNKNFENINLEEIQNNVIIENNQNNNTINQPNQIEDIETQVREYVQNLYITGVGDSVFLDTVDEMYKYFPNGYFDGKISRSLIGGLEVLEDLKSQGKLGNPLVLCLSTNGEHATARNKKLMELVENREVFWVTAYGADDPEYNWRFKNFAKDYKNIHIVDWEALAKDHPEYFYPDEIHIKGEGVKAYSNMIYTAVYNYYLELYSTNRN